MKLSFIETKAVDKDNLPIDFKIEKKLQKNLQLLKRILPLKNKLGISRISDITELDYIGIPVVSTLRPNVNNSQITATQGKGIYLTHALISALMEGVERYSAAHFNHYFPQTYSKLQSLGPTLHPEAIGGLSIADQKIDWLLGTDIFNNSEIYLPAAEILFPYHPQKNIFRPVRPSTTGLASGTTFCEALLSSLFETVERDATSRLLMYGQAAVCDINSVDTYPERELIDKFHNANVDIFILDLSPFSPIPVYYVSTLSNDGAILNIACAGQGAHLVPSIALRRALTEAAQSRAVAIQGSREDLIRHASDWRGTFTEFKTKRQKLLDRALRCGGMTTLPDFSYQQLTLKQLIYLTLEKLASQNYNRIYCTDLTHHEIKLPTVHTIIEGMVDQIVDPQRKRKEKENA